MFQYLLPAIVAMTAVGLYTGPVSAARLSVIEQQIVAHVDGYNTQAIGLLKRVVNINSGTMNSAGVREVAACSRQNSTNSVSTHAGLTGAAFDRAGHLVAERDGRGPHLLLIGHLDTVFEPDSPFQKYTMVSDNRAHAPGAIDMKGGDVIIIYALKALLENGVLDDLRVTVVMTGDEERAGRPINAARAALIEAARMADIAIAFENGDNDPSTGIIARRGSTRWRLEVTGAPSHSMNLFKENVGTGAIYEAARILDSFYEDLAGEEFLTFNPGLILGGTDVDLDTLQARGSAFGKRNVVAAHAVVTGDLRTLSIEQLERAKATMRTIVANGRPHTTARIIFDDGYPPMEPSDGNRRLLGMLDEVSRNLGFGELRPTDPGRAGAADVAFAALHVDMAIDGLGLVGSGDHTEQETADLTTMHMQTKRAAVLMLPIVAALACGNPLPLYAIIVPEYSRKTRKRDMNTRLEELDNKLAALGDPSEARVDLLIEIAGELVSGDDPQRMIAVASEARTLSEKLQYREGEAYGLFFQGVGCCFVAEHEKGLQSVDRSKSIFEKLGHEDGVAKTTFMQANLLRSIGSFDESLANFYKALDHFRARQDTYWEANCLYDLGLLYQEIRDHKKARDNFEATVKTWRTSRSRGSTGAHSTAWAILSGTWATTKRHSSTTTADFLSFKRLATAWVKRGRWTISVQFITTPAIPTWPCRSTKRVWRSVRPSGSGECKVQPFEHRACSSSPARREGGVRRPSRGSGDRDRDQGETPDLRSPSASVAGERTGRRQRWRAKTPQGVSTDQGRSVQRPCDGSYAQASDWVRGSAC